jgi:predicted transcriptional regulator
MGVSRQAIAQHLARLVDDGFLRRVQWEVIWDGKELSR